tara:strand:- start:40 stop:1275 length:1236 start_codon:yes stop_codon:yes gene_type:complete
MAKDILKEAIADAKAVREVALANAKAALEEAFTPKLQSMLSARLSEELDEENMEEMGHGMEETEDMEETYMDEEMDEVKKDMDEMGMYDEAEDMEEITGMENEAEDMEENLDEEIDLEEILNELELEEGEEAKKDEAKDMDEDMYEAKKDEEEKLDEMEVTYSAETANRAGYAADYVNEGNENFDLDALLEEINNLDEEETTDEGLGAKIIGAATGIGKSLVGFPAEVYKTYNDQLKKDPELKNDEKFMAAMKAAKTFADLAGGAAASGARSDLGLEEAEVSEELEETKAALEAIRTELNEVNLLNSKLLYVNRIFKANNLNEGQKLRVVETLDNASNIKEAKLIYETIKDTFTVANAKKASFKSKTKSIHEGLGMASKAAGTSTAPKKEVITEANDMVSRMQKLANIKIN